MAKNKETRHNETTRTGYTPPAVDILRRLEAEFCRCDLRPTRLCGRQLASSENEQKTAAKMAFRLVNELFDAIRREATGSNRPKLNQIEAHLYLEAMPLNERLSACFEGKVKGSDISQAREAVKFLLLGASPDQLSTAFLTWQRIDEMYFRVDDNDAAAGPRYFLQERRTFATPCSPSELAIEIARPARKLAYDLATKIEIVWVLGTSTFIRSDLAPSVEKAIDYLIEQIADKPKTESKIRFIYTDAQPECWQTDSATAKPSESLKVLLEKHRKLGRATPFIEHSIPSDVAGGTGHWAFIHPSNQFIYANVEGKDSFKEEYLYLLRGFRAGTGERRPTPFVSAANREELDFFRRWLKSIVANYNVSI